MQNRAASLVILVVLVVSVVHHGLPTGLPCPGSDDYVLTVAFSDPLDVSERTPGPCGCTNLAACVDCCGEVATQECLDWIHSVYLTLDPRNQATNTGAVNGLWLPTIDAVRDAARRIGQLKGIGVNTVSFGPDVVTTDVEAPLTVGDNAFRFYVKLFEDAGLAVHLVPNPMHWGSNDVSLAALTPILLRWAEQAEALDVRFYTMFNEVDGMRESVEETSAWLQDVLPLVKGLYSGAVCVQPTQEGFKSGRLDYSGCDCVSTFFSLMVPDSRRNDREIDVFLQEARRIDGVYPSLDCVLFTDVSTYSGGNWAETTLMEAQARALAEGRSEYSDDVQQADAFTRFLAKAYPEIDGCFFNTWVGFTFLGRSAESVVRSAFAADGTIPQKWTDPLWATPGLLELVERAMLTPFERERIFDLGTYVAGWAGLCHEPTEADPGPMGCGSVLECMGCFRRNPGEYWRVRVERCTE